MSPRRTPPTWRRRMLLAGVVPIAAAVILAAPVPDLEKLRVQHARYVMLTPRLGFSLCWDSRLFMQVAERPGMLLDRDFLYQSRPLAFVAAHVIGRAMAVVMPGAGLALSHVPGWWTPYLVLNAAVLVGLVWAFDAAVAPPGPWYLVPAIFGMMLVVNEVGRWFLCSPHTQLLTLLAPALCLPMARAAIAASPRRTAAPHALVLGTTIGVLVLAYGAFLVCVPVVVVASLLRPAGRHGAAIRSLLVFVVAACVPTVAWYGVVRVTSGTVYSAEISQFRQFVWPVDAAAAGALLPTLFRYAGEFVVTSAPVLAMPVAILAVAAVVAWWAGVAPGRFPAERRPELTAALVTLACETGFLYWLGYYRMRLSIGMMPPVLGLANVLTASAWPRLSPRDRAVVLAIMAGAAASSIAHVLTQDPPP